MAASLAPSSSSEDGASVPHAPSRGEGNAQLLQALLLAPTHLPCTHSGGRERAWTHAEAQLGLHPRPRQGLTAPGARREWHSLSPRQGFIPFRKIP